MLTMQASNAMRLAIRAVRLPTWAGFSTLAEVLKPKPVEKPLATSSPYVFVSQDLDPDLTSQELQHPSSGLRRGFASTLFDRNVVSTAYNSPKSMEFELPKDDVPEVAFVGRSNVGKSTLVGTLLGDLSLVRISKEPGRTRAITYFSLNKIKAQANTKPLCYVIDLPGYGFAKVSKKEQEQWAQNLYNFLNTRATHVLRRTFVLIDARHGPTKTDLELLDLMDSIAAPYQVVLTKIDLCTKIQILRSVQQTMQAITLKTRRACLPILPTVSAKDNLGIDELKWYVAQAVSS